MDDPVVTTSPFQRSEFRRISWVGLSVIVWINLGVGIGLFLSEVLGVWPPLGWLVGFTLGSLVSRTILRRLLQRLMGT